MALGPWNIQLDTFFEFKFGHDSNLNQIHIHSEALGGAFKAFESYKLKAFIRTVCVKNGEAIIKN